jgi:hypothetical protein
MAAVERTTLLVEEMIERRPTMLVGVSSAATGAVLGIADGVNASTVAATAVAGATVAITTLVVRVLLSDVKGLRTRIRELETREDARMDAMDAERGRMIDRIAQLESMLHERDQD